MNGSATRAGLAETWAPKEVWTLRPAEFWNLVLGATCAGLAPPLSGRCSLRFWGQSPSPHVSTEATPLISMMFPFLPHAELLAGIFILSCIQNLHHASPTFDDMKGGGRGFAGTHFLCEGFDRGGPALDTGRGPANGALGYSQLAFGPLCSGQETLPRSPPSPFSSPAFHHEVHFRPPSAHTMKRL